MMSTKQSTTIATSHEQNMLWRGEGIRHMVEQIASMDGFDELADTGYRCRVEAPFTKSEPSVTIKAKS